MNCQEFVKGLDPRGVRGLAERLGLSVQAVGKWGRLGWIPDDRIPSIISTHPSNHPLDREVLDSFSFTAYRESLVQAIEA